MKRKPAGRPSTQRPKSKPGRPATRSKAAGEYATSPARTGPAGPRLEGQIGAQYLLSLLGAGAPRGLPHAAAVTRVAFQRAASGHPMDDVVVCGHLAGGQAITLEIQVKRTLTFTAKDAVFADVVRRAVQVSRKPEFQTQDYVVAVAVGRTSTKIEQHVQTALRWARDLQDPTTFFEHLRRPGFGDQQACEFVEAFRRHMTAAAEPPATDEQLWQLLRRFLVLPFDFEAPGSQAELNAQDRCARALAPQHSGRAADLWTTLIDHALALDLAAGEATPESLKTFLSRQHGYHLAGDRRWRPARVKLAEDSRAALQDIRRDVLGLSLPRQQAIEAVHAALESARYVEIQGAGGAGKSAVLATLAYELIAECQVIVLAPPRVPAGGWAALRERLDVDARAHEFLTDVAGDGGGVLFVDGIDRFEDAGERATVRDLLRAAAQVPGFKVVATARDDFNDPELRAWLPNDALTTLGTALAVQVGELTDAEAEALGAQNESLAALLRSGHPAQPLARNLYRLERLARSVADAGMLVSEAQMARQWWASGDGADTGQGRRLRQDLLREMAVNALSLGGPVGSRDFDAQAVTELLASRTLSSAGHGHVVLAHDVLRDWAIGCLLVDEPGRLVGLPLERPAPAALARGVDIAARLLAEGLVTPTGLPAAADVTGNAFSWLLAGVSQPGAHGSWRRCVLLALARTERADLALTRCGTQLAVSDGALLQELIGYAIAVDSRQGSDAWAASGIDIPSELHTLLIPSSSAWRGLIAWTLKNPRLVPDAAVPPLADLYLKWGIFYLGVAKHAARIPFMPTIVAQLHEWLARAEGPGEADEYESVEAWAEAQRRQRLVLPRGEEQAIRAACLLWAAADPARTDAYLRAATRRKGRDELCRELLGRPDGAAAAAPAALADLFTAVLCTTPDRSSPGEGPFAVWDTVYYPASPARRPFLELLRASPADGLRLIHAVVAHAAAAAAAGRHDVPVQVTLESGVIDPASMNLNHAA